MTTPAVPGVPAVVLRSIRAGEVPSAATVARVAAHEAAHLGPDRRAAAEAELADRLVGFGPLAPVLADPAVTDVLVNGDGGVWADRGSGVERVGSVPVADLRPLAVRLAGLAGRRLDDAQPWVDGVLAGGVRLHAVLPPVADGGPHLSLRVARHRPGGVDGLEALRAVTPVVGRVLRGLVAARASLVVTGAAGAGKTTVLAALLAQCPPAERVVVVEDVRELAPDHPHVVRLQGRGANVEGRGAVSLVDLVRQALRMRPDRLVVGEVRGAEVRELLAALNTGHEGGMSTLHANGAHELPARVEALAALAGLSRRATHAQLRQALHAVVHVVRDHTGRRVATIGVVVPDADEPGTVRVEVALSSGGGVDERGPGWARLVALVPDVADGGGPT